jgi:hypothetical protein
LSGIGRIGNYLLATDHAGAENDFAAEASPGPLKVLHEKAQLPSIASIATMSDLA